MDNLALAKKYLKIFNLKKLTNLKLGEQVGEAGGFGFVFEVTDGWSFRYMKKSDGARQRLVMKFIRTRHSGQGGAFSSEKWDYFYGLAKTEINAMKALNDSGYTVPLLDWVEYKDPAADGEPVIMLLMPHLKTLSLHLRAIPEIKESDLVKLCTDIGQALAACHEQTIVHRDMKPGNLYCTTVHGVTRYLLGDFGASRFFCNNDDDLISCVGGNYNEKDPHYEERKPYEYDNDIFALCALVAKLIEDSKMKDQIGAAFLKILDRGMSDDRKARYQDGAKFLTDMKNLGVNDSNRGTVIRTNMLFRQAMEEVRRGCYENAEQKAYEGISTDNGCDALYLYCQIRRVANARMQGEGNDLMLQELLHEANQKSGRNDGQPFRVMGAMLNRMLGQNEYVGMTLKNCADTGYVPAMYYYGYFVCSGEIGGRYDDGVRYILDAAKKGCIEATEYLLKKVVFGRCDYRLQEEIRIIRSQNSENADDVIRWERQKKVPMLLRYI